MDDSFEKAAGAALPAKDPLGGVAVGLADPLAERPAARRRGFGAGRHALDLAARASPARALGHPRALAAATWLACPRHCAMQRFRRP